MSKKFLTLLVIGLASSWTLTAQAEPKDKSVTKEEQQKLRVAMIEKYDQNKDGVLDKNETQWLTKEDKRVLAKTGGVGAAMKPAKPQKPESAAKPEKGTTVAKSGK